MAKSKIKVLLCSPKHGTGGIATWTNNILEYYQAIDSKILLTQFYQESVGKGIKSRNHLFRLFNGFVNYIPFIIKLCAHVRTKRFDVVHFCSSASWGLFRDWICVKVCHKFRVRSIVHFRFGRIPILYQTKSWERKWIDAVISSSDKVIVIDQRSYDTLVSAGHKNITLLPNALSSECKRIIESSTIQREDKKIVFVGHVIRTKGVFELVSACRHIYDNGINIQLYIIGPVYDKVKAEIERCAGAENQRWLYIMGNQSHDVVLREMMSAGVFVLPTYTEGFPNVIIESMACGCPIVTTAVGAIPEMLNIKGESPCGICVEVKNTEQLRTAIMKILEESEVAKSYGMRARQRVNEQYSIEYVWELLTQEWQSLVMN